MKTLLMVGAAVVLSIGPAAAQSSPPPRAFVVVNGLYQISKTDFDATRTIRANAEDGRVDTTYALKSGPAFDVAGGGRIWRQLSVGVGVTRFSRSTAAEVTATIPHPFFFSRPRTVTGEADDFAREELAVHVQARLAVPISRRMQAMVFGGPSFFQVTQDLATDVHYTESYPYDTASFAGVDSTSVKKSGTGFNVGADVAYYFLNNVGVGGTVQFSRATIDLPLVGGDDVSVKAGGTQVGAGLRLRF